MELRYEEYGDMDISVPFIFNTDIYRNKILMSREMNWHENLEIQLCTDGEGCVLLAGKKYSFKPNDIIVVNSNVIHYTTTEDYIEYSALIINSALCRNSGVDPLKLEFFPFIRDEKILSLILKLKETEQNNESGFKKTRLTALLLELLAELAENYSSEKEVFRNTKSFERIINTIGFIKDNYNSKISLNDISEAVYADKYWLSREFKKTTGQTIVDYINGYRCKQAVNLILSGKSITEAANECGFENSSFFSKTFKRYMGVLPSSLKNEYFGKNIR